MIPYTLRWRLLRKIHRDPRFMNTPERVKRMSVQELKDFIQDRDVFLNECVPAMNVIEQIVRSHGASP